VAGWGGEWGEGILWYGERRIYRFGGLLVREGCWMVERVCKGNWLVGGGDCRGRGDYRGRVDHRERVECRQWEG